MSADHRIRFPSRLLIPLFLLTALSAGCQTTVGNYFANRGRDLGECLAVQVGAGLGLGVDVKAAGIAHGVVGLVNHYPPLSLGWVYGSPRPSVAMAGLIGLRIAGEGDIGLVLTHTSFRTFDDRESLHECNAVLPGVLSWERVSPLGRLWLWSDVDEIIESIDQPDPHTYSDYDWEDGVRSGRATIRKARVHAFDIEASVFVGIVGARAGFSPGEFVDFLLGWFGVDIAGDDRGLGGEEAQ